MMVIVGKIACYLLIAVIAMSTVRVIIGLLINMFVYVNNLKSLYKKW